MQHASGDRAIGRRAVGLPQQVPATSPVPGIMTNGRRFVSRIPATLLPTRTATTGWSTVASSKDERKGKLRFWVSTT